MDRDVDRGTYGNVRVVQVTPVRPWRYRGQSFMGRRRDAHNAGEGHEGYLDACFELYRVGGFVQSECANGCFVVFARQKSQLRQMRHPPPISDLDVQNLHGEHITGFGTLDEYRAGNGVSHLDFCEIFAARSWLEHTARGLVGVGFDDAAGGYAPRRVRWPR